MKPKQRAQASVEPAPVKLAQRAQAPVKSESGREGARKTSERETQTASAGERETSGREGARKAQSSERRRP